MAAAVRAARVAMAERSLRVLVSPTPTTFAERRAVLQVLEQHGPVDVFRMEPGCHGVYVSVTREPATAAQLVASSPLSYSVAAPRGGPDVYAADLDEPAPLSSGRPTVTRAAGAGKTFELDIFPEPDYNHRHAMSGSPFHHTWPEAYANDGCLVAAALEQAMPRTLAAKGLAHWLADANRSASPGISGLERRLRLKSWLPSRMAKD